jgi:hypothetical protein
MARDRLFREHKECIETRRGLEEKDFTEDSVE